MGGKKSLELFEQPKYSHVLAPGAPSGDIAWSRAGARPTSWAGWVDARLTALDATVWAHALGSGGGVGLQNPWKNGLGGMLHAVCAPTQPSCT